jgi:hypothetical protein
MYLDLAKKKYKVLDDNEIIKIWIGKGINEDFGDDSEVDLLAKQALNVFTLYPLSYFPRIILSLLTQRKQFHS